MNVSPPSFLPKATTAKALVHLTDINGHPYEHWQATDDIGLIIRTPLGQVRFLDATDNPATLAAQLARFWPASDPRLSRIAWPCGDLRPGNYIYVYPEGQYADRDATEMAELARKLGRIAVTRQVCSGADKQILAEHGCCCWFSEKRGCFEVIYKPEVVARQAKRAAKKQTQRMPARKLHDLVYDLRRAIPALWQVFQGMVQGDRWGAFRAMLDLLALFDATYGRNAHRRLACFQQFLDEWRKAPAANRARYNTPSNVVALDWLERELRARRPKELIPAGKVDAVLSVRSNLERCHPNYVKGKKDNG